ncbi:Protein of unknown function [Cotesia congregata]|uniref:Uncharacterized protein n=1 Tax=Cotesia congregata TaxID=51543 RepID=A0A8J2MM10_COTCN|nr:Protein of unknown function [Cotesia congregata]
MEEYHPGDTINIYSQNNYVISKIFNGFSGAKYIKIENVSRTNGYEIFYESCLPFESLDQYLYPDVFIDQKKSSSVSSKLFHYIKQLRNSNLNVKSFYIDNHKFLYGIVKLCKTVETKNLNIKLINRNHFPKFYEYGSHNILMNETILFRLKQDNETHYISSVNIGTCLFQIYVHQWTACDSETKKKFNHYESFFQDAIYKTPFITVSYNHELENSINGYYFLHNIEYSLHKFRQLEWNHQNSILNMFGKNSVVYLELQTLAELPHTVKPKNQPLTVKLIHKAKLKDLHPGYLLNLNELLGNNSDHVSIKNILTGTNNFYTTNPFVESNYLNCSDLNESESPSFGTKKFNIFYEIIKHQNYGVDRIYLNQLKTCLKIIVCSKMFHEEFYIPKVEIIKLNQGTRNNFKKNIFENKNIITMYLEGNETHFINHTEKGECLVQVIVFPFQFFNGFKYSSHNDSPVYMGKILSASNNETLKTLAGNLFNNDLRSIIEPKKKDFPLNALYVELNKSTQIKKTLLSVYLNELY